MQGPPREGAASAAGGATELFWRGRALTQNQVAAAFFLGSTAILFLGVAVNYVLTGGAWLTPGKVVSSSLGAGPSYLTDSSYDITSLVILVLSLFGLGVGFLAALRPRLNGPAFGVLALVTAAFVGAWALHRLGWMARGDPLLIQALAGIFGLVTLIWLTAARIGVGPRMHQLRAAGFVLFGFYWATQLMRLYVAEEGDFVNAVFAGIAVFGLNYFAYHEMLSLHRKEDPRALHWLAGAAFLTTGVYVATHKLQVVSEWLILRVAEQTTWLLQLFGQGVVRDGGDPGGSMIFYPTNPALGADSGAYFAIQIILACTAIQSIMIFVGGILALRPPRRGEGLSGKDAHFERLRPTYQTRRLFSFLLTVPLIYTLNLFRNVIIIAMSGTGDPWFFSDNQWATDAMCALDAGTTCGPADAAFWFSHNVIGKGGSLLALIILAFMVFQILPELYDSIVGLLDLKERRGPLERWVGQNWGRRGNGRTPMPAARAPTTPTSGPAPTDPAT